MKLGEELVKRGLITREHLKLALERQVVFGGRIGTNLVELGILKEDEFTKFLSSYLRIKHVDSAELAGIDKETIACLSAELADKYKVVPYKLDKKKLHVAMMDPTNVQAMDELRFMSGYDIIPHVSLELRILYALEKYYGIKRDLRFISTIDKESEKEDKEKKPDFDELLRKVKKSFLNVSDRDEVAGIVSHEALKVARRICLFLIKGNSVYGWVSKGIDVTGFETQIVPPSIFNDVIMKKNYYRGPLLKIPENADIIKLLGGTPQDCLVMPINIRDRIIALLYADNGNAGVLEANLTYLNTLCQLATLSFEMLIVKRKIMDL